MIEEWLAYLRDNVPELYEAALRSVKHQAAWRDREIEATKQRAETAESRLQAERQEVERLRAALNGVRRDMALYRCCALSGEIPTEGSQPSAITKTKGDQQ